MNPSSQLEFPEPLVEFCREIVLKHASVWPPEESKLAREFVARFGIHAISTFENQIKLCESLGITVSEAILPENLRGHNCCYGSQREIQIRKDKNSFITREHTLLHELREILEHIFQDLGYPTARFQSELETRAETFAAQTRTETFVGMWMEFIPPVSRIESKWRRWGPFALLGLFGFAGLYATFALPVLEAHVLDRNPRDLRNVCT